MTVTTVLAALMLSAVEQWQEVILPALQVPSHIPQPDYASSSVPRKEMESRQQQVGESLLLAFTDIPLEVINEPQAT